VFYDPEMALSGSGAVGADAILRHIDAEAAAVSIEVTLYLPWGVATGITVPSAYFGHYVASFFTRNDAEDVAGRIRALENRAGQGIPSPPESPLLRRGHHGRA
jgi:hypothetical protein